MEGGATSTESSPAATAASTSRTSSSSLRASRWSWYALLVVGDHLSAAEFPFATSTAAYAPRLAALIELLRRDPPARVVPGPRPELCVVEALAIARADLSHLWALHRAVRNATGHDEGRTAALMVPRPRAAAEDLDEASKEDVIAAIGEVFGPRNG